MGCDIHVKTYLWSNIERRYIDALEICESEYNDFPDIVKDRFYDLFGVFGCTSRSYYPKMDGLHEGMPPFLKGSTLDVVLHEDGSNWGYVWIELPVLLDEIAKYIERLKDPELYYRDKDSDQYLDYKDGLFSKDEFEESNRYVVSGLEEVSKKAETVREVASGYVIRPDQKRSTAPIFDVEKTIFLIWFDN